MNNMVELVVSDILSKASENRAYVMLLKEVVGYRKMMVVIGYPEAQAIALAINGTKVKRPLTHDLFCGLADALGATLQCVTINKVDDGTFYSHLLFRRGEELHEVDARTSDAVAIALRFGAPIYISEELLQRVAIRDERNGAISIPITIADMDTLRRLLDNAVEDEDYELAMNIKKEMDSRISANGVSEGNEPIEENEN